MELTGLLDVSELGRVVLAREVGLLEIGQEGCAACQVGLEACRLGQGEGVQHSPINAADHLHRTALAILDSSTSDSRSSKLHDFTALVYNIEPVQHDEQQVATLLSCWNESSKA